MQSKNLVQDIYMKVFTTEYSNIIVYPAGTVWELAVVHNIGWPTAALPLAAQNKVQGYHILLSGINVSFHHT